MGLLDFLQLYSNHGCTTPGYSTCQSVTRRRLCTICAPCGVALVAPGNRTPERAPGATTDVPSLKWNLKCRRERHYRNLLPPISDCTSAWLLIFFRSSIWTEMDLREINRIEFLLLDHRQGWFRQLFNTIQYRQRELMCLLLLVLNMDIQAF